MFVQLCGQCLGRQFPVLVPKNGLPSLARKNVIGLHRAVTSTQSNTFEINWTTDCEPDPIYWIKASTCRQDQHLVENLKPEDWRLLEHCITAHSFECSTTTHIPFTCPHSLEQSLLFDSWCGIGTAYGWKLNFIYLFVGLTARVLWCKCKYNVNVNFRAWFNHKMDNVYWIQSSSLQWPVIGLDATC